MQHVEERMKAPDGADLYLQGWRPEAGQGDSRTPPVAALALVHGGGDHSGRYRALAGYFTARGFAVYALDLRGHGRSGGARGRIRRFDEYLSDVAVLMAHVHRAEPGRPVFLVGHSLGGLIVLRYAIEHPDGLAGVVASAPFLRMAMQVPAWKLALGRLLSALVPDVAMYNEIDPADLSRDPAVVEAYRTDPLVHDRASTRLYTEILAAQAASQVGARRLTLPVLLLHGSADRCADPRGTQLFYENVGHSDRQFRHYEGAYHEIFNEPEKEAVFHDIETWLNERIG